MRKLNISDYQIEIFDSEDKALINTSYEFKRSLINVLFHPQLQLTAIELLERDKLGQKILSCNDGSLLLEDAEYGKIRNAMEEIRGFCRADVEFVKRIMEAEQVEVTEK